MLIPRQDHQHDPWPDQWCSVEDVKRLEEIATNMALAINLIKYDDPSVEKLIDRKLWQRALDSLTDFQDLAYALNDAEAQP